MTLTSQAHGNGAGAVQPDDFRVAHAVGFLADAPTTRAAMCIDEMIASA
jgi:hypothetical protein